MSKCYFNKVINFIETTLRHGCSPVNLVHSFRTPFYKNTFLQVLEYEPISLAIGPYSASHNCSL